MEINWQERIPTAAWGHMKVVSTDKDVFYKSILIHSIQFCEILELSVTFAGGEDYCLTTSHVSILYISHFTSYYNFP